MNKRTVMSIVAVCVICVAAGPATRSIADVSPTIAEILAKHPGVPALGGATVELDGASNVGVSGVRRLGSKDAIKLDDAFHLGSCTKSMTALLIGRLIDAKELRFDTTMKECFPKLADKMDPQLKNVTVRQLLDHRSGLGGNLDWNAIAKRGGTPAEQRLYVAQVALCAKPDHQPGVYLYSNLGFTILGAIVDSRSGAPWEETIQKQLFTPLGMTTAGFGPLLGDSLWGHDSMGAKLVPSRFDNPPVMNPAGRVHCSMADWSRYIAACLRACRADTDLINAATFCELTTPPPGGDYAGGWIITDRPWAGGRTLTHGGSNKAWFCVAWLAPERGFAVLSASTCGTPDAKQACDDIAAALIGKHAEAK